MWLKFKSLLVSLKWKDDSQTRQRNSSINDPCWTTNSGTLKKKIIHKLVWQTHCWLIPFSPTPLWPPPMRCGHDGIKCSAVSLWMELNVSFCAAGSLSQTLGHWRPTQPVAQCHVCTRWMLLSKSVLPKYTFLLSPSLRCSLLQSGDLGWHERARRFCF